MDVSKLILLVQRYPELYNMRHPEYCNISRRDTIWEEIGAIMNTEGSLCKDRWAKVRDNHRKALKRRQRGQCPRPPKFEKELMFLVAHIGSDENHQPNFTASDSVTEPDVEIKEEDELGFDDNIQSPMSPPLVCSYDRSSSASPSSIVISATNSLKTVQPPMSKKRTRSGAPIQRSAATVLNEYLQKKNPQMEGPEDSLNSFFITMAKTVKGFPVLDQIELKRSIFNLITDKEMEIAMREYQTEPFCSNSVVPADVKAENSL